IRIIRRAVGWRRASITTGAGRRTMLQRRIYRAVILIRIDVAESLRGARQVDIHGSLYPEGERGFGIDDRRTVACDGHADHSSSGSGDSTDGGAATPIRCGS